MEFESFEQALEVCMEAEEGSAVQEAALRYCLQTAPPDLRVMLEKRLHDAGDGDGCGCGCHK
ncbi:MAG: hypothetical protein KKG47_11230 [Proteobacteria bacterium]|nr:hypothetical protein [Pseudomonadota bacterium]MBU1739175.1 hypothetical protein [Pseudomonadota bacterium]